MRLWRLSGTAFARIFDGGYGLIFDGRWNTVGRPVTYAATSPSLCVLEKLVHVDDPHLLPALAMVSYEVPDDITADTVSFEALGPDWRYREDETQTRGNTWLDAATAPLLIVPSVIVPLPSSPDLNVLINHRHAKANRIRIEAVVPFALDVRLLSS